MQAIIFDFDGTVVDTESAIYESWREVYEREGGTLSFERWAEGVGGPVQLFDPYSELEAQVGRKLDRKAIQHARRSRELELIAAEGARPGIVHLLDEAQARGLKVGLASNSHRDWVERHLIELGIEEYFDALATADEVERLKPDPDLYLLAAERLGVTPRQALAIEDSPSGAAAAVRAGLVCLVVPSRLTRGASFPMAHAVWETLGGASVDDLEILWKRVRAQGG